jgi:hypothetical protein
VNGLDDGLDALLALGSEPLLERPLRAHGLVEALGQGNAADALALCESRVSSSVTCLRSSNSSSGS